MKKIFLIWLLSVISFCGANGQQYFNRNEIHIISFKTTNGRKMILALNKVKQCLIYRFGTEKNIEFQYPKEIKEDYSKFGVFHYLRGGGIKNEGEDLFQLQFTNEGFNYKIYHNWYARGNKEDVGILVSDNKTKKQVTIKGDPKTMKGSLMDLIDLNIIQELEDPDL